MGRCIRTLQTDKNDDDEEEEEEQGGGGRKTKTSERCQESILEIEALSQLIAYHGTQIRLSFFLCLCLSLAFSTDSAFSSSPICARLSHTPSQSKNIGPRLAQTFVRDTADLVVPLQPLSSFLFFPPLHSFLHFSVTYTFRPGVAALDRRTTACTITITIAIIIIIIFPLGLQASTPLMRGMAAAHSLGALLRRLELGLRICHPPPGIPACRILARKEEQGRQ